MLLLCASAHAGVYDWLPDDLRLEAEHISHATQHEPFTSKPTDYRFDAVSLVARWHRGPLSLEIGEGESLDAGVLIGGHLVHGALLGPREVFHARLGLLLWRK